MLIITVRMMELSYFSGSIPLKAYIALIGIAFLAIGVYVGKRFIRPSVIVEYVEKPRMPASVNEEMNGDLLSRRELDVLQYMAMGDTNQEIADKLFVSLNTVKTHTNNIYSKLDVKRRTQAVQRAKELHIIP